MNDDEKAATKKDLLEALGAMEQRLYATLTALEQRFDGKLAAIEQFDGKLTGLEERLREYVHDTETNLLTAFHSFSTLNNERLGLLDDINSRNTRRLAELEAAGRLSALELRVAEIEKKLDRRQ